MNIYFHPKRNIFLHKEKNEGPFFWGVNDEFLPLAEDIYIPLSFKMKTKEMWIGPLIGILTSRNNQNDMIGDRDLFIGIQTDLQKIGGLSFLYSLEDCQKDYINGICYSTVEKRWIHATFPYPNLIYNRISSRKQELEESFIKHVERIKEKKGILFNPGFIDKYMMHEIFSKNDLLNPLLPDTILIDNDKNTLQLFLQNYQRLYLKPSKSSQGNGIKLLTREENEKFQIRTNSKIEYFTSFSVLQNFLNKMCLNHSYIAQKAIDSDLQNGRKYDFRILSHYEKGQYIITGIGIRIAKKGGITTHISKGGEVFPFHQLDQKALKKDFQWIVEECGNTLSSELGFFGEFTIDLGLDLTGKIWIYEVNAKPMKFDEVEIEKNKFTKLINLFYELTNFS
jgi:glutathione synthase/RimK-type ligase-like ATP-grasp enzyme